MAKQRTREKRTEVELFEGSKHLFYEVDMMLNLGRDLGTGKPGAGHVPNAVLEAFTIHTRVLLSFLYDQSPRTDDMVAEDYFTNAAECEALRPPRSV